MTEAGQRIAAEITDKGAITFARFMELALYCPNIGYYEREKDIIGRRGDYYTSVSVGPLFGELLAFQFAEWLQKCPGPDTAGQQSSANSAMGEKKPVLRIVEAGAHAGDLAKDILGWLRQHRSSLLQNLEYWIVEPSGRRRIQQQQKLGEFSPHVHWVRGITEFTRKADSECFSRGSARVRGIIFSNELLDAMPVHRLGWDAKAHSWFEWGVTLQAGGFIWTRNPHEPAGSNLCLQLPREDPLLEQLPDGFTIETSPAAEKWWREAALALGWGKLVAIDYGLLADELFTPERTDGTIRSYRRHQSSGNVLASPGEQDITAHVNFTAIRNAGESAGLRTDSLLTQARFLTGIVERACQAQASFGGWTSERTRQFTTLTHPEHLGRSFRVLVQSRAEGASTREQRKC